MLELVQSCVIVHGLNSRPTEDSVLVKSLRFKTSILVAEVVHIGKFPNISQISFFPRSYGLPAVPEPAGCTPELPGEIIKNTDSWAPPSEIVNQ